MLGDLDGDEVVDSDDLDLVVAHYNEIVPIDINQDSIVAREDLLILSENWNNTSPITGGSSVGDFNEDGYVDSEDWSIFGQWIGFSPAVTAVHDGSPVPEPAAIVLAAFALLDLLTYTLRRK